MLIKALKYKNAETPIPVEKASSGKVYFCPGCKNVVYPVKPEGKSWHFRLAKGRHHSTLACWRHYDPTTRKTVAASSANGILDAIMTNPDNRNRGGGGGTGGGEGKERAYSTVTQMIEDDLHKLPPDVPFGDGSLLCDALIARPSYECIMDTPEQLRRRILEVRMNRGINTFTRTLYGVVLWGKRQRIGVQVTVDDNKLFLKIKDDWYSHEKGNDGKYHWNPKYDYMYFACNWTFEPSEASEPSELSESQKERDYTVFGILRGTIVARKQVAKGSKKKAK